MSDPESSMPPSSSDADPNDDGWVSPPAPDRNFSPWAQVQLELAARQAEEMVPTVPEAIPGWRARTRGRLSDLLGRFPRGVPLQFEVTARVDCGVYTRESVVFDTEETMSVPAYLLVPHARQGRGPAVLAIHGHGSGKDDVCGVTAGPSGVDPHPGAFGHDFAAAGYLVLAPDLREFGQRSDVTPEQRDPCDANLVAAVAAGRNPLTANLFDLVCALDLLEEHPLADPGRLGVAGFSLGGTMSLFLAALDARVRAAIVSGFFSSWRAAHAVPYNLCGSQVLYGMLGHLDHVDLGALVAPRALLIESGEEDPQFSVEAAQAAVAELRPVFTAMRAPHDALAHHTFPGGHRWDGASALAFFERWL